MIVGHKETWKWVTLVVGMLFVSAVLMFTSASTFSNRVHEIKKITLDVQEATATNRALNCMNLIVDNDRTFDIPSYCMDPEVLPYYPGQICISLNLPAPCGIRS